MSFYNGDDGHKKTRYKSFDCSIMDIADEISYSIHDLEDAIFFKQINKEDLEEFFKKQKLIRKSEWEKYPAELLSDRLAERKKVISKLIHQAIIGTKIFSNPDFSDPVFKYYVEFENPALKDFIMELKKVVKDKLINTEHVKSVIHGGMVAVMQLFDAYQMNPDLLPQDEYRKMEKENNQRVIADYISGMTDQYLFKMHQRMFGSNNQNTFIII